jgi:hypothetical protein
MDGGFMMQFVQNTLRPEIRANTLGFRSNPFDLVRRCFPYPDRIALSAD